MRRIVIADAGPLIALARIEQLDLLPQLFGSVCVTDLVASEVIHGGIFPDTTALKEALAQDWLETITLLPPALESCKDWVNLYQIDMGEASALVLADQAIKQGDEALVIVDEARGRVAARHAGIAITGTAGLLLLAKAEGLLSTVKPLLTALRTQGYFLSPVLVSAVLRQAKEE